MPLCCFFYNPKTVLNIQHLRRRHFDDRTTPYLIPRQNFEGSHDLVGSVRVGRLAGHEVDEGLEGDDAHPVGIHYAHDARELVLTLVGRKQNGEAEGRDDDAVSFSSNI